MVARVTDMIRTQQSIIDLNKNLDELLNIQRRLSTSRRINAISDDPVGVNKTIRFEEEIAKRDQYQKNMDSGVAWLNATSTALQSLERLMLDIVSLANNSMSSAVTSAEREANVIELNNILDEVLAVSNAKFQGKFIFGGTATLSGTHALSQPFTGTYVGGGLTSVAEGYRGTSGVSSVSIDNGVTLTKNITGQSTFEPGDSISGVFETLITLRNTISSHDTAGIKSVLSNVNKALERVLDQDVIAGARIIRMHQASERHRITNTGTQESLSKIRDADIILESIRLREREQTFQAALRIASDLFSLNILSVL